MLAPQYTLRRLLALVTASGFVCLLLALAVRGHAWAVAMSIGLAGLAAMLGAQAAVYLLMLAMGSVLGKRQQRRASAATDASA